MLDSSIRDIYLVDELQLDNRLSEALHEGQRAEFDLLLAMLSQDVTDEPQFYDRLREEKDDDLRARFSLAPEVKKYADNEDYARDAAMSEVLSREGMTAVNLYQALAPSPLTGREEYIKDEVVMQLPPLSREKLRAHLEDRRLPLTPILERGEGFLLLDEIQSSLGQIREGSFSAAA